MDNAEGNNVSYYDGIAKGYEELHFEEQREKFNLLIENMHLEDFGEDARLLDVGCGTFFSFDYFRDFFRGKIYGIEPSQGMVDVFLESHPKEKGIIKVGFAEDILKEFEGVFFDAIICVSVAHHFSKPGLVFNNLKKICVPSAIFGITVLRGVKNLGEIEYELNKEFFIVNRINVPSCKDLVYVCKPRLGDKRV